MRAALVIIPVAHALGAIPVLVLGREAVQVDVARDLVRADEVPGGPVVLETDLVPGEPWPDESAGHGLAGSGLLDLDGVLEAGRAAGVAIVESHDPENPAEGSGAFRNRPETGRLLGSVGFGVRAGKFLVVRGLRSLPGLPRCSSRSWWTLSQVGLVPRLRLPVRVGLALTD